MILPVTLETWRSRKDKSLYISFSTQEVTDQQIIEVRSLEGCFGVLYFRGTEKLSKSEIEELDKLDIEVYDEPKTQSQRLRGVLYRNWEQNNEGYQEFKDYYKHQTDKIIEHYKSKLD